MLCCTRTPRHPCCAVLERRTAHAVLHSNATRTPLRAAHSDFPTHGSDTSNLWELTQKGRDYLERSGVKNMSAGWFDDLEPLPLGVPQSLRETKLCAGEEQPPPREDETPCTICGKGDSEIHNQMLLCDRCDKGYHLGCMELCEVPDGDWFCRVCRPASGDGAHQTLTLTLTPTWLILTLTLTWLSSTLTQLALTPTLSQPQATALTSRRTKSPTSQPQATALTS